MTDSIETPQDPPETHQPTNADLTTPDPDAIEPDLDPRIDHDLARFRFFPD